MSQPKFYVYPGLGEWARDNMHYSQAVRLGDRILCSGQGTRLPFSPISPIPILTLRFQEDGIPNLKR